MLLIIASYRNGDYILALPGKVQRFGSYQRRLHYRRFYFVRRNFFLLLHYTSFTDSRFTFVILHLYVFTVDSQFKRHLLHLCNKRTLIIYAYFFFLYISFHIMSHRVPARNIICTISITNLNFSPFEGRQAEFLEKLSNSTTEKIYKYVEEQA